MKKKKLYIHIEHPQIILNTLFLFFFFFSVSPPLHLLLCILSSNNSICSSVSTSFLFFFCFMCLLVCGHCPSKCENKIFKIFERVESKTITCEALCFETCAFYIFFSLFYVPFFVFIFYIVSLFLLWSVPLSLFFFLAECLLTQILKWILKFLFFSLYNISVDYYYWD